MATSRSCVEVVRRVHRCHATGAELAVDAIAVNERRGQTIRGVVMGTETQRL